MAIGLAALGLLAFLLGCSGTFAEPQSSEPASQCSLSGSWKNDLGSTMEINSVSDTGVFSGVYKTAVWPSDKPVPPAPLQGTQFQGPQPTFAFTVSWKVTESVSVFVGQCLVGKKENQELKTTWLLRVKVGSEAEDWGATRVGASTFYRTK